MSEGRKPGELIDAAEALLGEIDEELGGVDPETEGEEMIGAEVEVPRDMRAWGAELEGLLAAVSAFLPLPAEASYGERVAHLIRMSARVAALQHGVSLASLHPADPEEQARDMAWVSAQGLWQGAWPVN